MIAATQNKRKSFGNQNGSPKSAKKIKQENVSPKKPNSNTPQRNPKQQQSQATPANIKNELVSPSAKTPKLQMFSGTANLSAQKQPKNKNTPGNPKGQPKKELNQSTEGSGEGNMNRHKRRREKSKIKRVEAREKLRDLKVKVIEGDVAARREVEDKIKELQNIANRSKNCERKLQDFQRMLRKPLENKAGTKANKNQQVKAAPKKQQANQKKPQASAQSQQVKAASKMQKQAGGKQTQNLKVEQPTADSDESDEEEEESDSKEGVMDEEASDEEEQSSDLNAESDSSTEAVPTLVGVEDEESSEEDEDEEEGSDEEDEDEEEDSDEEAEDSDDEEEGSEEQDSDEEIPQKKNKPLEKNIAIKNKQNQQGANKNKQTAKGPTPTLEDVTGKGKMSRYVVFVGNLPYSATKQEITEHFKKIGEIADVRIPSDKITKKAKGFAYIEVTNDESYQRALSLHHTLLGGRRINVLYTQGGKKKSDDRKGEIKAKNFKLQAMRKQGMLIGSVKADQKRSVRRAKQQQFQKQKEGA